MANKKIPKILSFSFSELSVTLKILLALIQSERHMFRFFKTPNSSHLYTPAAKSLGTPYQSLSAV